MATLDGGRIGMHPRRSELPRELMKMLEYSKNANQFGKPICQQQIVSFKLARHGNKNAAPVS